VVVLAISSNAVLAQDSDNAYQLGRGYKLGNTGIQLGGYASFHGAGFGDSPWSLELSDLSLFVTWDTGSKLRFFSEIEIEEGLHVGQYTGLTTRDGYFKLERLYLDYLVNDRVTVRIGKMLTPVGQWNLLHVDPLLWTTTRPVATENLFSEHVSGVMVHGTIPFGDQSVDYSVYGDYSSTLDARPITGVSNFDNALGARLRYNISDDLQIGLSYSDFTLQGRTNSRSHLLGLDGAWTYQRFAFNSEIVYRYNDVEINQHVWQGYIQGVSALKGHVYGVARYEFFDQVNGQLGQVGVLGLAYHPRPPLIWKLEYRLGTNNRYLAPDGVFASFAVLF
jgi:hypothetical protein